VGASVTVDELTLSAPSGIDRTKPTDGIDSGALPIPFT